MTVINNLIDMPNIKLQMPTLSNITPPSFPSIWSSGSYSHSLMTIPKMNYSNLSFPSVFSTNYTSLNYTNTNNFISAFSFPTFSLPKISLPSILPKIGNWFSSTWSAGRTLSNVWQKGCNMLRNDVSNVTAGVKGVINKAVALAKSCVGIRETSTNDSSMIRNFKNGVKNAAAWCGSFFSWCFGRGQNRSNKETFGYTASSQAIRKKAGNFFHSKLSGYVPKLGDAAIWTKSASHGHVGIVTAVKGFIVWITQGNYGNAVKTVAYDWRKIQNNGGKFNGFVDMSSWLSSKGIA